MTAKLEKLRRLKALQAEAQRRESERLRKIDVFGLLGYVPTPKQQEFHDADEYDLLYGGAAGGGKVARSSWRLYGPASGIRGSGSALSDAPMAS
ncbi:hypothetical protein [Streptomyces vinaceus]|uniref:hypothetical protein n=1 Tax=Streptomyces vinaceus TaxID=1960 RepID=UPI0036AAF0B7